MQCQICKITEIRVAWFCPSCEQPICLDCSLAILDADYKLECFNIFCAEVLKQPEKVELLKTINLRQKWADSTIKASKRYGEGVRAALGDLPERGARGDPRNIERVARVAEALHKKKLDLLD